MSEKNDITLFDRISLHFSIYRAVYGLLIILGFILVDWVLYPEVFKVLQFAVLFILIMTVGLWYQARNSSRFQKRARDRATKIEYNTMKQI